MKSLKVGVVGATGMVGQTFMNILEERKFPISKQRPFASESSEGKKIQCENKEWSCQILKPGCFDGLDVVFFSSGDDISKEWAPLAVKAGAYAVDNSAAFRMDSEIALVVPEVNGDLLAKMKTPQIIANPNCSTIQLIVALKPLQDKYGIEEVRVSSYQAVSGGGLPAYEELLAQTADYKNEKPVAKIFPHPIIFNAIPQIGSIDDQGFSSEEVKIQKETKKSGHNNLLAPFTFTQVLDDSNFQFSSFGTDYLGELYVAAIGGTMYRVESTNCAPLAKITTPAPTETLCEGDSYTLTALTG